MNGVDKVDLRLETEGVRRTETVETRHRRVASMYECHHPGGTVRSLEETGNGEEVEKEETDSIHES